ncbi:hypothetical protein FBU30_009029 [Linnemannia zychae]|nr:hypothetical protein FBU30_009029 [Linnemannia zychae]
MPILTITIPADIRSQGPQSACQCKKHGFHQDADQTRLHPSSFPSSPIATRAYFDQIASTLSTADAASYPKQWQAMHHSDNWTAVYLPSQHGPTILSPEQQNTLLNYANSIHRLSINIPDILFNDTSCTNLTHLICRGSHASGNDHTDNRCHHNHCSDEKLLDHSSLDLICQNPKLQSISLAHAELVLPYWKAQHLKSFKNLTELRTFSMDFDSMVAAPDPIKTILSYCPDSIQELCLTNLNCHFRAPTSSFRLLSQPNSPRPSHPNSPISSRPGSPSSQSLYPAPSPYSVTYPNSWRTLPALHSLTFECRMADRQEDLILFLILQHSPQLERLKIDYMHESYHGRLAITLLTYCPHIKSLELFHIESTEQEFFRLVDTFKSMDQVALCITPEMNRRAIPSLIKNSGSTLQSARLLESSFRHPRESTTFASLAATRAGTHNHVAQFLGKCPQLTTLEVQLDWASFNSGINLRNLVETKWATDHLENLILSIFESESESDIRTQIEEEVTPNISNRKNISNCETFGKQVKKTQVQEQQQRQIALWVLELCRKLKVQPHLKKVRLSWLSPCYQMSFADASAYTNGELDQEYLHNTLGLKWL